jgi:hypothetical protein
MDAEPDEPCRDARFRASAALDGMLDDIGLRLLRSHLDGCPGCARFVSRMRLASTLLQNAPRERFRCELTGLRRLRLRPAARGLPWATAAVAVLALAFGTSSVPRPADSPARLDQALARDAGARDGVPLKLPLGQRSAADDFALAASQSASTPLVGDASGMPGQ